MIEKLQTNHKAPKFKVNNKVGIPSYESIFSKGYTEHCSEEIFIIDSVLKTNPWTYKIKDNVKIRGIFYQEALLLSIL